MQTRTYSSLMELIQSLCGVQFASIERPRIKAMANSRADKAYEASPYWPRFLKVGEERVVTNSLIPYEQDSLDTIGTFLSIYRTAPFISSSAQKFAFSVDSRGATIVDSGLGSTSAFVTYKSVNDAIYGDSGSESSDIPKEWFQFMAHGTYADFLRSEGQQEKAIIADQEAMDKLNDELLKISESGTINLVANNISTVAGMQLRW